MSINLQILDPGNRYGYKGMREKSHRLLGIGLILLLVLFSIIFEGLMFILTLLRVCDLAASRMAESHFMID
jgi:hypothetical protein